MTARATCARQLERGLAVVARRRARLCGCGEGEHGGRRQIVVTARARGLTRRRLRVRRVLERRAHRPARRQAIREPLLGEMLDVALGTRGELWCGTARDRVTARAGARAMSARRTQL